MSFKAEMIATSTARHSLRGRTPFLYRLPLVELEVSGYSLNKNSYIKRGIDPPDWLRALLDTDTG